MFEFSIQPSCSSDELMISFASDAEDKGFRAALKKVMTPHGFDCRFDEHHIYIDRVRGNQRLRHLSISSDEWCVFGETNTHGENPELNHELIHWLASELVNSGLFKTADPAA